jgi:hypothetical protein
MALVYKRSTKKSARRYERSSGMESNRGLRSNPGVNALTVVNSGRPRDRSGRFLSGRPSGRAPKSNPFQWIGGRKRQTRMSPAYRGLRGAKKWMGGHPNDLHGRGRARLYATDEYGTVLIKRGFYNMNQERSTRLIVFFPSCTDNSAKTGHFKGF